MSAINLSFKLKIDHLRLQISKKSNEVLFASFAFVLKR